MSEKRAEKYLKLMEKGLTYREIGEIHGISKDAVRGVVRRYLGRKKSKENKDATSSVTVNEVDTTPAVAPAPDAGRDLKILTFDIETAPATALVWSPRNDWLPMTNLLEQKRVLCYAAKWLDGPMMFASEWDHGRDNMLQSIWDLFNEADVVVGYNSDSFDIPTLNWEFVQKKMPRYAGFKSIDLIKVVRKHMGPMYKKLDFLTQSLLDDRKVENGGMDLWKDLIIHQTPEARLLMREYNKKDVVLTEDLYLELLPWIDNHPPVRHSMEEVICRSCGSEDLERAGWKYALMLRYPMYQCRECGSYSRTTAGRERITNVYGA